MSISYMFILVSRSERWIIRFSFIPLSHPPRLQAQLLEAKKQLETQNTLQQKTRELLRGSEQQVAALKAQLASAPSSEAGATSNSSSTPAGRTASLRTPIRGTPTNGRMQRMVHEDHVLVC